MIYIIAGDEGPLVDAQCTQLLDKLLEPEQRTTALFNADADKVGISEVLDELRTLPFLADRRVVLIKKAEKFISNNRELLEKYFDNPSTTGTLIMTVSNWDARTRLAKKLPVVGKLFTITDPKPWQLAGKLIQYTKEKYQKTLARSAAEMLVEVSGPSLAALYSEIDKLSLLAEAENTITADHVRLLAGHNRLFGVFAVIDSVIAGNAAHAVERLRKMLASDKSAEYTAIGAFAYHLRKMFKAKVMLEKGLYPQKIAATLRIWHNKEAFFAGLRRLTTRQIGNHLCLLAETDFNIKTARATPKVALEQLVLNLAASQDSGRK